MHRYYDESVAVVVASPGGSGTSVMYAHGEIAYVEVKHLDAGDPDYTLQVVNKRGTVIWESAVLTGDCIVHTAARLPAADHSLRISASTLAGTFQCNVVCSF